VTGVADCRDVMSIPMRPSREGANIHTWIGFKHLMHLMEEATVQWFRARNMGPQRLYHEFGLGLEIVDTSALLPALLEIDDEVVGEVIPKTPARFSVKLAAIRKGARVPVLRGSIRVALARQGHASSANSVPGEFEPLVVSEPELAAGSSDRHDLKITPGTDPQSALIARNPRNFLWSWQARYFHCHYSDRVRSSAYIRALEEVVERFLAHRGLSIRRMLEERGWIPVVSRVRVQLLANAHMDERIHTAFVIEEILKDTAYDARMDCYVQRGDIMAHTATARILHGYAASDGPQAGQLAVLDGSTKRALMEVTRS
jgi:acyl-CoA thioesterase FadM